MPSSLDQVYPEQLWPNSWSVFPERCLRLTWRRWRCWSLEFSAHADQPEVGRSGSSTQVRTSATARDNQRALKPVISRLIGKLTSS